METRYKTIKHIGEGAFSSVILALNMETGDKVAIKKMKKRRWKDTAAQAEINALHKLNHENVIRLLDVFREDYRSFLVFECMDCDLNELVVSRHGRRLPDTVILDITYQVLNGLDYIHKSELFHRDIKPENVLIRRHVVEQPPLEEGGKPSSSIIVEAKIADFGLVHDMDFSRPLTDYISTRWYRAPEVLLNCTDYSTPIDVWAVGTIISELATLHPLFPGANQIDQLRRIFEVLGTPRISAPAPAPVAPSSSVGDDNEPGQSPDGETDSWYEGAVHARKLGIAFVPSKRKPLDTVIDDVSPALVRLIDYLLVLNPAQRPTAYDGLMMVSELLDQHLGVGDASLAEKQAGMPAESDGGDARVPESKRSEEKARHNLQADEVPSQGTGASRRSSPVAAVPKQRKTSSPSMHTSPTFGPAKASTLIKVPEPLPPSMVAEPAPAAKPNNEKKEGEKEKSGASSYVSVSRPPSQAAMVVTTSRPSVEVSIVEGPHKVPTRDPRGDLSDLARAQPPPPAVSAPRLAMARRIVLPHMRATTPVSTSVPAPQIAALGSGYKAEEASEDYVAIEPAAGRHGPSTEARDPRITSLRARSHSASTTSSVYSVPRSIVVSPASSQMLSPSTGGFSLSDIPSPGTDDGLMSTANGEPHSVIGKVPLMAVLAQQEGSARQRVMERPPNVVGAQSAAAPSTNGNHVRKAPGISAGIKVQPPPKFSDPETRGSDLSLQSMDGFVPLRSPAVMVPPSLSSKASTLSEASLGSPLIRRALSIKKKTTRERREQQTVVLNNIGSVPSPQVAPGPPLSQLGNSAAVKENRSPVVKRSRSELALGNSEPLSSGGGLLSIDSLSGQFDLSAEAQAALEERISQGQEAARPDSSLRKSEWISNTQYLRQRLAGGGSRPTILPGASVSSVSVVERSQNLHNDEDDNTWLALSMLDGFFDPPALSSGVQHAGVRSCSSDVAAAGLAAALRTQETAAAASNKSKETSSLVRLDDSFAPVTFDAGSLFRRSLLDGNSSAMSPSLKSDVSGLSPADYMATFNDVRRKLSESRPGGADADSVAAAAAAAAAEHAGTHRFLSKMKNAFIGRQQNSGAVSHRKAMRNNRHRSSSDAAASSPRIDDCAPRLDFDLGASLLTPDSLHQRVQEEYAVVTHTSAGCKSGTGKDSGDEQAAVGKPVKAAQATVPATAAAAADMTNDSAYYLIDYINSQAEPDTRLRAQLPTARRVVNKSTRARQTQYEYNYGSQIFETMDKDLLLLKTDVFKGLDESFGLTSPPGPTFDPAAFTRRFDARSSSLQTKTRVSAARPARRRPADATAATAYTAAALNRIVAHNTKARNAPTAVYP
ncbi:hypothetical protein GGF46_004874 [Coemansia sp. RSA 552]|nr:hypothetical protein GGF46_004874 [Coemansia sp. RSA 552]